MCDSTYNVTACSHMVMNDEIKSSFVFILEGGNYGRAVTDTLSAISVIFTSGQTLK